MTGIRSACALSLAMLGIVCIVPPVPAQTATPAPDGAAPAKPSPAPDARAPGAVTVPRVVICRDVQEREPVGPGTTFPSDVGALACFTQVAGAEGKQIYHRWYVADRMVLELPIAVGASAWRCWSRKKIDPSWTGAGRVDVATEAGDVIASQAFTLVAAGAGE